MDRVEFEKQYWEEKAKSKDVAREMHDPEIDTEAEIKIILAEIPINAKTILEIGCGVGRLLIPTAKEKSDCLVWGMDISQGLIDKLAEQKPLPPNLAGEVGSGRTLLDHKFDFIYSVTVFQHIDQEGIESYFSEVGRVLRKGGKFLFQFIQGIEHEPMSHHYSFDFIHQLLLASGMQVVKVEDGLVYPNWTWITARKL